MSDVVELKASVRERVGKGAARAIRREGNVPAVIYGDKKAPEAITLNYVDVFKQLHTGQFMSTVFAVEVDGKKTKVLARDFQLDPVTDFPLHVDFLRLSKGTKVSVSVSVEFINDEDAPGLKRGGALNIVRHELEITCAPDAIPSIITVDLTGLEIGASVHISDIELPEGVVSTITDRDITIATITGAGPSVDEEEEAEGEEGEGEEGEGEGDDEAEGGDSE